jgi:hypothetical protein
MTPHFKSRGINKLAPYRNNANGYDWDLSAYAFDENFLERQGRKRTQAAKAKEKWWAKRKK